MKTLRRFSPNAGVVLKLVFAAAALHLIGVVGAFTTLTVRGEQRNLRALFGMMLGLYVLWIIGGGIVQWRMGARLQAAALRGYTAHWRLRFFLFCVAMAMIEEAVTTLMTNAAPLFGVRKGAVYITASANYWDVVLGHSLVVIAPAFLAWVVLLGRYRFRPVAVLLLFGITGTLMEMVGDPRQAMQAGMWILVYGLMVYLPACTVPTDRPARPPKARHYLAAALVPFLFLPLCIPVIAAMRWIRPSTASSLPPIELNR